MAGAGYRNWTAGDIPTATQFDTFLQEQTVMVFADAAARDTALSVPKSEGMVALLLDTNRLTVYTGSVWSTVGPVHGALTAWTPTWTQTATISKTVSSATYSRVGRTVHAWFNMTATSAGTASAPILFGLPVASTAAVSVLGTAAILDASQGIYFTGYAATVSATTFGIILNQGTGVLTGLSAATAVASGDAAYAQLTYEAAGDA